MLSTGEALLIAELIKFLIREGVSMVQIKKATDKLLETVDASSAETIVGMIDKAQDSVEESKFSNEDTTEQRRGK